MTLAAQLDTLRTNLPGCQLAVFGDLSSRLVLRSSSDLPWPQEKLDGLCRTAAQNFALSEELAAVESQAEATRTAVVATSRDIRVFVGAPSPQGDMICCVCRQGTDTNQATAEAHALLSDLMSENR